MNYAIIGCGRISVNHFAAAQSNKLNIVAICDINENAMKEKAEVFNLSSDVKRYTDYKKMIEENKIELIGICTESGKHASK